MIGSMTMKIWDKIKFNLLIPEKSENFLRANWIQSAHMQPKFAGARSNFFFFWGGGGSRVGGLRMSHPPYYPLDFQGKI